LSGDKFNFGDYPRALVEIFKPDRMTDMTRRVPEAVLCRFEPDMLDDR
jgi:hypothetical protein